MTPPACGGGASAGSPKGSAEGTRWPASPAAGLRVKPPSARRLARTALKKILYGEIALRLFGHMILAVAVKP